MPAPALPRQFLLPCNRTEPPFISLELDSP
jgi:hypothetical protein